MGHPRGCQYQFFYAHATVKYIKNLVTQLIDDQGHELVNHSDKAELIWQSFKERLGTTNFMGLRFDLSSFFNHTQLICLLGLSHLERRKLMQLSKPCLQTKHLDLMALTLILSKSVGQLFVMTSIIYVMLFILNEFACKV